MSTTTTARAPERAEPAHPRTASKGRKPSGLPWITPALILAVGLIYYCIAYTGVISTWDWDGMGDPESAGLSNYTRILGDEVFWRALWHTVLLFVVVFTCQVVLGLVFAVILHSAVRLKTIYKIAIFLPNVLAPAIMAPVFRQLYAEDGQINDSLRAVGLGDLAQTWLGQSSTALWVIIAITVWQSTGFAFILYYAAVSQVDQEIIEAARIDGAGNVRMIVSMVAPLVKGTTISLGILSAIGSLKMFDIPYLVTQGGPNYATEFLGTMIYRMSIPQAMVGYGAALSIILLVLAVGIGVAFNAGGRRKGARS